MVFSVALLPCAKGVAPTYGIPYWLVLNSTKVDKFPNYTDQWTTISKEELIAKIRKSLKDTDGFSAVAYLGKNR